MREKGRLGDVVRLNRTSVGLKPPATALGQFLLWGLNRTSVGLKRAKAVPAMVDRIAASIEPAWD